MQLWFLWWRMVTTLRPACSRRRTFLWMSLCLVAITLRPDLNGVSSFMRSLGLLDFCYDRILDFFHSPALDPDRLARIWTRSVLASFRSILRVNGKLVLVADGLKIPKEGRKMPAVKSLHQESESNSKPEYIMGHSCQVVSLLVEAGKTVFAVPLSSRIHEGLVFSNRDRRTLLDKLVALVQSLDIREPAHLIVDAFYASAKIARPLTQMGWSLICRVKSNAVAYLPPDTSTEPRRRGRPRIYGQKVKLTSLLDDPATMNSAPSPVYGEHNVPIRFRSVDLLWRPLGLLVRFVAVIHPTRGRAIYMAVDRSLPPIEIIRLYGLRYKIEVSFKQAIHSLGAYAYRFWMKSMVPIKRCAGNQYLHRKSDDYRNAVRRKITAYHRHIQIGLISQGLAQCLSACHPQLVWSSFGSWLRTMRPDLPPSEQVTMIALRSSFPQFLLTSGEHSILTKFIHQRMDFSRSETLRLTG